MKVSRKRAAFFLLLTLFAVEASSPVVAAKIPVTSGKIKDCYNLSVAQIDSTEGSTSPILCGKPHNSEVFAISKWRETKAPTQIVAVELIGLTNLYCALPAGNETIFNTVKMRLPTAKAWKLGERWVRCEGMNIDENRIPSIWKGLQLKGVK